MNTKQIEYVLEVSKTKNFNRAAENLFISQPSLSYQIKVLEEEVGFEIFERSGKGATLTLAGRQFCENLEVIRDQIKRSIERSQHMNQQYENVIRICLPTRTALQHLPEAIRQFKESHPKILVDVTISEAAGEYERFLAGEYDMIYSQDLHSRFSEVEQHHLYDSHIFVVANHHDPIAKLESVKAEDLSGQTLLIGSDAPIELRALQQQVLEDKSISSLSSDNYETTLTNILANRGVSLIPGMKNDYSNEFAWIPFETDVTIPSALCYNKNNVKKEALDFIALLDELYRDDKTLVS